MEIALAAATASAAVKLLSPYLKEVASGIAKEVGSQAGKSTVAAALAKAKQVYELVQAKLRQTTGDTAAIEAVVERPSDPKAQTILQSQIQGALESDDEFAGRLSELLQQVAATKADVSFVNNIQSEVRKLVQIGSVIGDVKF